MHQLKHKWLLIVLLTFMTTVVNALPEDKNMVATFKADFADLQQSAHHSELKGHVQIVQGSTTLTAARVIIDSDEKNKMRSAKAFGKATAQAHYSTQTDKKKPILNAYADKINYYPLLNRIDLIGHAKVVQGGNVLSANKISYDTIKQRVISQSSGKKRVHILIDQRK